MQNRPLKQKIFYTFFQFRPLPLDNGGSGFVYLPHRTRAIRSIPIRSYQQSARPTDKPRGKPQRRFSTQCRKVLTRCSQLHRGTSCLPNRTMQNHLILTTVILMQSKNLTGESCLSTSGTGSHQEKQLTENKLDSKLMQAEMDALQWLEQAYEATLRLAAIRQACKLSHARVAGVARELKELIKVMSVYENRSLKTPSDD